MQGSRPTRNRGLDRFYNPPHVRKQRQEEEQRQRVVEQQKKTELDVCESMLLLSSSTDSSNLDRFVEHTTPVVHVQYLPKTSNKKWRSHDVEHDPYFVLGDLWESFKEWSAYGAGVPLLLDGNESVQQYYVPYLSAIQLYVDPSRPSSRLSRRPGEESDAESSRETSSDGSSDQGVDRRNNTFIQKNWNQQTLAGVNQSFSRLSLRNKPVMGSSSDESEICDPPGHLIFEYLEHDAPFSREPLADKISILASRFPELKTYRSCDLLPSSWMSVAWYPIYRIPMGPTLRNLDACFLTFHSLSPFSQSAAGSDGLPSYAFREHHNAEILDKMSLSTFGLAYYKFKLSFWNKDGDHECPKANSLLRAADNWLRRLHVNHPDYRFFSSHGSYAR